MRVLFLCKRHPQHRDLLERPYGRFFHLPAGLAARGHEVCVALLSHRWLPSTNRTASGVAWHADDALPSPRAYLRRVNELARTLRPDWIIGASDTYFGIVAAWLGRRHGVRCAIDAYDNFESYMPWAFPLHLAWRRALGRAALVTAPGPHLLERLRMHGPSASAAVVPMAADPLFRPRDKSDSRRTLGLPEDMPLIGYCGSLFRGRGAETLLGAFERLRERQPGARLVSSGRVRIKLPAYVQHLGYLPDDTVPAFLTSMDVACVTAAPNAFGRYTYPAKLYEALACQVPVVATDVPPIRWIVQDRQAQLVAPDDPADLAARLEQQLASPCVAPAPPGWDHAVQRLERALAQPARA